MTLNGFEIMIRTMKISFAETAALVHAEKHFPAKTPLRWHLIAEYVAKCVPALNSKQTELTNPPLMIIGIPSSSVQCLFQATPDMCKTAFGLLSTCHPQLLNYSKCQAEVAFSDPSLSAFKPIVLLPSILSCCGRPVLIR